MTAATRDLAASDHALLAALRAFGEADDARFWNSFDAGWKDALNAEWPIARSVDPATARQQLAAGHSAQARPDLSRIHPTWWVRALKDETTAIQRTVVSQMPPALRDPVLSGLGLTASDLTTDRPAAPEVLEAVRTLWAERLVGDVAERDDDPPVIIGLTRFDVRDISRLIHAAGLVKWALAWSEDPPGLRSRDRERFNHFRQVLGEPSPRLKQLAKHDVAAHRKDDRHEEGRLGLITIARLLEVAEPFRVRWALQHVPYNVAKFTRSLMRPRSRRESSLATWETQVLRAAWERLVVEGRIGSPFGDVA